jgi:hypothetical protein
MLNLRQLEIDAGNIDGARASFQKLIVHLVKLKHRNAIEVLPAPGDWGIDALVGTLTSGTCFVWQAKYFMDGIRAPQKRQIGDSFETLLKKSNEKHFKVDAWQLCVPCALSPQAIGWWEKWKKEKAAKTDIKIDLMCISDIEQILMTPEAQDIRHQFNLGPKTVQSVVSQTPGERVILNLPVDKSSEYESSLFIRKLVLAGITENMSARCQFFNAELIQKEIHDKGDEEEMGELISLYGKIHSMWETRFIQALQKSDPETETRKVYSDMLKSIEEMDKGSLYSPRMLASFVHKQGFMQQLADACKIGWTPDFRTLDKKS